MVAVATVESKDRRDVDIEKARIEAQNKLDVLRMEHENEARKAEQQNASMMQRLTFLKEMAARP